MTSKKINFTEQQREHTILLIEVMIEENEFYSAEEQKEEQNETRIFLNDLLTKIKNTDIELELNELEIATIIETCEIDIDCTESSDEDGLPAKEKEENEALITLLKSIIVAIK